MGLKPSRVIRCLLLASLLGGATFPAHAEDRKADREREALKRTQQALHQAQEQSTTLQTENATLQDQLKAAAAKADKLAGTEKQLAIALPRANRLSAELAKEREAKTELEQKLAELGAKYDKLSQDHTDALRTIASRDAQIRQQTKTLTQTRGEITACEDKNVKLYSYGTDLMQRYRDKGVFDAIRQAEPLTGLKQAQIDNVLEEYRDKLDAQKIPR